MFLLVFRGVCNELYVLTDDEEERKEGSVEERDIDRRFEVLELDMDEVDLLLFISFCFDGIVFYIYYYIHIEIKFKCVKRESNPQCILGRDTCYHYTINARSEQSDLNR